MGIRLCDSANIPKSRNAKNHQNLEEARRYLFLWHQRACSLIDALISDFWPSEQLEDKSSYLKPPGL